MRALQAIKIWGASVCVALTLIFPSISRSQEMIAHFPFNFCYKDNICEKNSLHCWEWKIVDYVYTYKGSLLNDLHLYQRSVSRLSDTS